MAAEAVRSSTSSPASSRISIARTQLWDLQIRIFDKCLGPGSGNQFLLVNHLAGVFDQGGEDVKGATAEPHRVLALEQEPLRCKQPKWSKSDRAAIHGLVSDSAPTVARDWVASGIA
jgi:hypothetical protein